MLLVNIASNVYFLQSFCKFLTLDTQKLAQEKKCTSIDTHNLEFDM